MTQNDSTAYFAEKTLMIHLIAMKKCALNAIKLDIKQNTAKKKTSSNVQNVIIPATKKTDA